jgi:hypothetical protein
MSAVSSTCIIVRGSYALGVVSNSFSDQPVRDIFHVKMNRKLLVLALVFAIALPIAHAGKRVWVPVDLDGDGVPDLQYQVHEKQTKKSHGIHVCVMGMDWRWLGNEFWLDGKVLEDSCEIWDYPF